MSQNAQSHTRGRVNDMFKSADLIAGTWPSLDTGRNLFVFFVAGVFGKWAGTTESLRSRLFQKQAYHIKTQNVRLYQYVLLKMCCYLEAFRIGNLTKLLTSSNHESTFLMKYTKRLHSRKNITYLQYIIAKCKIKIKYAMNTILLQYCYTIFLQRPTYLRVFPPQSKSHKLGGQQCQC